MSFNLNNLVQPECGGSNPLVLAAHQITSKPSSSSSMMSRQGHNRMPVNLSMEFMKQQQQQVDPTNISQVQSKQRFPSSREFTRNHVVAGGQLANHQSSTNMGKLATEFLAEHELSDQVSRLHVNSGPALTDQHRTVQPNIAAHNMMAQMMGPTYLTTNQLAILNNDTVASTSAADQLEAKYRNDMISQSSSSHQTDLYKVDDLEFWQTLSQRYIGPSTYGNITRLRTETQNAVKEEGKLTDPREDVEYDEKDYEQYDENTHNISEHDTTSITILEEYIFDERNPLKDQFENPFEEGLKRLELGDIPSAALLFEAAVQLEPENTLAWRYLGTTQAQNEKDNSAISALHNCLKYDPTDQQARLAIAVSLTNEHYYRKACIHLIEWLKRHQVYSAVGVSSEIFNDLEKSKAEEPFYAEAAKYVREKFVEAARMSPNNPDPEVQSSLGVLFNMNGDYEKAVDCFKAALSVRADDSLLWNRLGATLANGNKSDEAVVAYRKALQISPGFLRSRYNLAISLINLNTYDEAAKQLVQVLNMQAAGQGSKNTQIRTRSITSTAVWNTLRLVSTLMNKPDLYPIIDGRDLPRLNEEIFGSRQTGGSD